MIGIIIAILSGAMMSIQGVFNTGVTKQTSIWTTATFVQFTALLVSLAAWLFAGKQAPFASLFEIDGKYMLLGGVIGIAITYTVIKSVAMLGPAQSAMIIVTSQLIASYLIELFGLFGTDKVEFAWRKLIALVLVVRGIILFQWSKEA